MSYRGLRLLHPLVKCMISKGWMGYLTSPALHKNMLTGSNYLPISEFFITSIPFCCSSVLPKIDVTNQPAITCIRHLALCGHWQIISILPVFSDFLIIKIFIKNTPHQAGYIFSSSSRNPCLTICFVFQVFIASWYQLAPSMTINFIQCGFLWITVWYFSRSCVLQSFSLFVILILSQMAV